MADTGWLKPAYTSVVSVKTVDGNEWVYPGWFSDDLNQGASSWAAMGAQYSPKTRYLSWDWVVPVNSFPSNAVVVGIECNVWGYYYQHVDDPDYDCNITELKLGSRTLFNEAVGNPVTQLFRLPTGGSFPARTDPLNVAHLKTFGGPTSLFGLASGTKVSTFLAQNSYTGNQGQLHGSIRVEFFSDLHMREVGIYLPHSQLKVHYAIPATNIDMASAPEVAISIPTASMAYAKNMDASPSASLLILTSNLGGGLTISASPEMALSMAGDISTGIYIDSTAFPEISLELNAFLSLIRNVDMEVSPLLEIGFDALGAGVRIDMAASPEMALTIPYILANFRDMYASAEDLYVEFTIPPPILQLESNLASGPFIVLSTLAMLEGDIILSDECVELSPQITLSIAADLGYTKGLGSNPIMYLTMNPDGLTTGGALSFSPMISLLMQRADLRSKYAEPAPDHRTVFACPENRTIVITRKDKTIV